ncbi:MAG: hypothetical protein KDC92_08345 [Bacteroidetes bacterium]|nr:hypothetical protein [Bacteroidota bacterium]
MKRFINIIYIVTAVLLLGCNSSEKRWIKGNETFGDLETAIKNAATCTNLIIRNQLPSGKTLSKPGTITDDIAKLVNLKTLSIYGINQTELPQSLGELSNLETIYINGYNLMTDELKIHGVLSRILSLKKLTIRNCNLSKVPPLPKKIEHLDLANNHILIVNLSELPTSLRYVALSSNDITTITSSNSLKNLEVLDLAENQLEHLHLNHITHSPIRRLSLSMNPLKSVLGSKSIPITTLEAVRINLDVVESLISQQTKHAWLTVPQNESTRDSLVKKYPSTEFMWFYDTN